MKKRILTILLACSMLVSSMTVSAEDNQGEATGQEQEEGEVTERITKEDKPYLSLGANLSEEQKAAVEKRLLETTRYHSFDMDYKVDPSILGGLIIRIEDRVVDSSLKTQLDKLTKQLSKIQLS